MVQNIITDLCHHLEIGIDGNLDIGNKRVIVGTPTITLTNNILTITCDTVGANIYYTLDGSTPTSSSTKYTSAVTLNNSCTIKAIAIKDNKSSIVVSQDYIVILTAWKLMGNSEVHGQEIWSCGEYSELDNKWHIRILPEGYGVVDIALDEPLRKVGDVADSIEFINGVATLTRVFGSDNMGDMSWSANYTSGKYRYSTTNIATLVKRPETGDIPANMLCPIYSIWGVNRIYNYSKEGLGVSKIDGTLYLYDSNYKDANRVTELKQHLQGVELIYELATPTTETIQVPQIQEADSYSCVISQGGKAVSWSSFTPNPS